MKIILQRIILTSKTINIYIKLFFNDEGSKHTFNKQCKMVLGSVVQYQSHNLILRIITDMIYFMLLNFSIFLSFPFFSAKIGIKVTRWIWKRMGKGQQNNSHLLMKFQMGFGHQEIVIQILMLNEKIWHSSLKTRCDIYHYLISLEMQGQPDRECLCVP